MTDPLDGIFDNLLPEDFQYTTTAVVERPTSNELGPFVAEQLYLVRCIYAASSDEMLPVAVVANETTTRFLVRSEDEGHLEWYERLAQEARTIHATRTFVAFMGTGIALPADDERVRAIRNQEDLNRTILENPEAAREMLFWYLQQVDWTEKTQIRMQGQLKILEDGSLDAQVHFDRVPDGMQTAHDAILNF